MDRAVGGVTVRGRGRAVRRAARVPGRGSPVLLPALPALSPYRDRSMLNYIWAGLIVSSLVFALGHDVRDISRDRYRNGRPLPVALSFPEGYDPAERRVPVEI